MLFFAAISLAAPRLAEAQDSPAPEKPAPRTLWSIAKEGTLSFIARYRLEAFERDGAPFTATAFAPTLRLALGYATPEFHGFSLFAQGEAVIVTGPADYSDPTLPSQNRPNLPAILDPKSIEMNQGYLKWTHKIEGKKLTFTVGRQEMALNDGRFLRFSDWRQVHGSFDAARADVELPAHFSFAYAFINQFHRQEGYNATDGSPHMHSHLGNLLWIRPGRVRASLYALLLDYRAPAQFTLSTKTFGARLNGPYEFGPDWKLVYTADELRDESEPRGCQLLSWGTRAGLARFLAQSGLRASWRAHADGQTIHAAFAAVQRLERSVFPESERGRRERSRSAVPVWFGPGEISRRDGSHGHLLRLPFRQPARALRPRTGHGAGL
jgi:hypothetical protein